MNFKLLLVAVMCVFFMNAQVTNEDVPVSWKLGLTSKQVNTSVFMKDFDLNTIIAEDAQNDTDKSIPYRFGYELKVDLGLENSGSWYTLDNGDRIWRINIVSEGAKTMNFILDSYNIPEGATLYVYNNDRSDLLGAYTNIFNRPDQMLGTWLIEGDDVWLEYFEPVSVSGEGDIHISKVIHGYRSVTNEEIESKALGSSGSCNRDVDCSIGDDFDELKERLKHAVGFIIMDGFVCTGTLINNTSNDKAPYFLTANHCNGGNTATWAFRFNWISPVPSCATNTESVDAVINQTTSGATILATNTESDFRLLRLDGGLDDSWDLEWAGWDRTGNKPAFVVGIHHPSGDIMKVCREDNGANDAGKVSIGGISLPVDSWEVEDWDLGVTEGGSSGSALFDQNGRIVGQLAGGGALCSGLTDNGAPDYYGRFVISWDFGSSDSSRLSNWLDPENTGEGTLNMLSQQDTGPTEPEEIQGDVDVFFNITKSTVTVANAVSPTLQYIIYDMTGQKVKSGRLISREQEIDLSDKPAGMYFVNIENTENGASFTKKVIIL
ncbi:T9SS type A sorting domain-containing protein [Aquimarina pacifica]|uniref:T9SS type A sorting domain-containing protein n=1 Tax=Aquimarina pacifica TaxID=1296415 RepID=UPI0012685AF3|nr:T9SS type A sorting domain-containing protein [Aquimarina pacifica]